MVAQRGFAANKPWRAGFSPREALASLPATIFQAAEPRQPAQETTEIKRILTALAQKLSAES
jgi:hypothetical protein